MQMWQMQEAKASLSEVVKCAETIGPQNITVHGQPLAVVISHAMEDVPLERDKSLTRKVSL